MASGPRLRSGAIRVADLVVDFLPVHGDFWWRTMPRRTPSRPTRNTRTSMPSPIMMVWFRRRVKTSIARPYAAR